MIGKTIAHYDVESRLGAGGMGTVYLARDTRLGRRVAIKVLTPEFASDPSFAGRLLREARAASNLNHPHIVTVHEIGHADGIDFIVMEYVEGQVLARAIPPGGLPVARVVELGQEIAGAVTAAHHAGIVHRDLKPGNVMLDTAGCAKVLDFGLARSVAPRESGEEAATATLAPTASGTVLGTVGYMSPEQIQGRAADARSDVFALGIVLYEMLTGARPFTGDSDWAVMAATVNGAVPSIRARKPEAPAGLVRVIERCLAPRPEDRYASAAELGEELARLAARVTSRAGTPRAALVAGVAIALVALGVAAWALRRESRIRWATGPAIAEIDRLTARDDLAGAYLVGRRALAIAPDDSRVRQAWANLTETHPVTSDPPGAAVSFASYVGAKPNWVRLATTPAENVTLPMGLLRWRLTKPGYDTLVVGQGIDNLEFRLVPTGTSRPGMALVPHASFQLENATSQVDLPDYWLDRHEVTNREFKAFVDAGGYRKRQYWTEAFVKDGRTLSWEQAMSGFRDPTGRNAPSTWELATYPEGQADFPVGGVSWYEAAAYARFAGKQLPTVYHWYRASGAFSVFSEIVAASNFSGKGLAPAGSMGGLGPYGTVDMAGNVKEWCWNDAGRGRRYIAGGAWNEADYMFHDEDAQSPFERRPTFGFRCMLQHEPLAARLTAPLETLERDPRSLKPVSDDVYEAYRRLYDYDPTPLEPKVESVDDANPAWRIDRVSIRAAYGNERLPIFLFVPKSGTPPYQAVVHFPGSGAVMATSSRNLWLKLADFLPASGRVLVYPVYQGTYERRFPSAGPDAMREKMIQRGKDLRRTLDYLATRRDIDSTRVAYYGISLGGELGPLFLAIEPRFRTGVFFSGGFATWNMPPECDPVNFTPHVKAAVLMVNGREDFDLPYATAQLPMFKMLGTPAADKRHVVFEGGHIPPHPQAAIREVLDWLDERMGPVK
jgi:dienelactone hydrolase